MSMNERVLVEAFRALLEKLYGSPVPADYRHRPVHGVAFDKARREVEREYKLHEDERLYAEWFAMLMMRCPYFLTEDDLS